MNLSSPDGTVVTLLPVAYELPDDKYDAVECDWLVIELNATTTKGTWSSRDALSRRPQTREASTSGCERWPLAASPFPYLTLTAKSRPIDLLGAGAGIQLGPERGQAEAPARAPYARPIPALARHRRSAQHVELLSLKSP